MDRSILRLCVGVQLCLLAILIPVAAGSSLDIRWSSGLSLLCVIAVVHGIGWYLHRERDRLAPMVLTIALLSSMSALLAPAQYYAVQTGRPLIDPWLARADALLGIHVPDLARWTAAHPVVALVLWLAYGSLVLQSAVVPVMLQFWQRADRQREFLFLFHFCAIVTVASLALYPAACAFQYYGFTSTLPQDRFIAHFNGLRDGTFREIDVLALEGLISMPSFHTAVGLMTTWAMRGLPPFAWMAAINLTMVAATVLSGAHYVVDLLATAVLFAVSVGLERAFVGARPAPAADSRVG